MTGGPSLPVAVVEAAYEIAAHAVWVTSGSSQQMSHYSHSGSAAG